MHSKVILIGNLSHDPELKFMPDGTAVASFSVATNRKWTNKDGSKGEETTWYRVSAWRQLAENCNQYLSKGRQVYVEGTLTPDKETGGPRAWTDKAGNPRASYEINAAVVKFLGGGDSDQDDGKERHTAKAKARPQNQAPQDEIPF